MKKKVTSIMFVLLVFVGVSLLWFVPNLKSTYAKQTFYNDINEVEFEDLSNGIYMENALPTHDVDGLKNPSYKFKIINKSDKVLNFTLFFLSDEETIKKENCIELPFENIRFSLKKNDEEFMVPSNVKQDGTMINDSLAPYEERVYELKIWIDFEAGNEIMNTHFHSKVGITDNILEYTY